MPAYRNNHYALMEWDFMDSNLDRFLLYDFKGTTAFWGDNIENYDYEADQTPLRPKKRRYHHLTPEEFWNSEEPYKFHINGTHYCHAYKFRTWLVNLVEQKKQEAESYEQRLFSRLG